MSELKPCQMTMDEAIGALRGLKMMVGMVGKEALDIAISALRRAQPDNAPLTPEDLRGMDSQPIYIKHLFGKWHWDGWHILENCEEELIMHDGSILLDENYGKTWLAYRRKKEDV